MIDIFDQISLMKAVEQIKPTAKFLTDTFFPQKLPTLTQDYFVVEYRKMGRMLAPYIIEGTKGLNIGRVGSNFKLYRPPMVGMTRTISPAEINQRSFGETLLYSQYTPEQRAAQMQARDLVELQGMIENRKNKMAADILKTGGTTIEGYADDGKLTRVDEIKFDWNGNQSVATAWSDSTADIYSDISKASEKIQEETGTIPTLMIVGKNVPNYLINNKKIKEWLMVPNRENLAMLTIQPKYESPQILRVGIIQSLNLEIYSYRETYLDDEGKAQPFIGDDDVIIANPGQGSQMYGSVTLLNREGTRFETYASEVVPYYRGNVDSQTLSLTLYSRFLLVPSIVDSWIYMNVGSNNELPSL